MALVITSPSPLPFTLTQVSRLFRAARAQLDELDALARETVAMERELRSFLHDYYARIMPLTLRLERLRYRKMHGVFPGASFTSSFPPALEHSEASPLALRQKSLFRALVKRCHPDQASTAAVPISEVYEAKTLGALWLLSLRIHCEEEQAPEALSAYLAAQQQEMAELGREARRFQRRLAEGSQWQLKERVEQAALDGIDLIDDVERRIEAQIAGLRQHFTRPLMAQAA